MPTETLHFENARIPQQLLNSHNLRALEQNLGVKATSRDTWIKLEGSVEAIQRAREMFQLLESSLKSGARPEGLHTREFLHALNVVANEGVSALRALYAERIHTSTRKANVTPKTAGQKRYVEAIRTHDVTFGLGPAGTGKTYLAIAKAVEALEGGRCSRIVLSRPAVEAGESLGFLPGDLQEKLAPYLRPLYDALTERLGTKRLKALLADGVIEIAPVAYMRGRTLSDCYVVIDEAQNCTYIQLKMLLTRLGWRSTMVLTGDPDQTDLLKGMSGLGDIADRLERVAEIAVVRLGEADIVRHPLVAGMLTVL
jgi:phosphate starvation-inducible PhoH-like protein